MFMIDHVTGVVPVMGAILKCPVAVNCTIPEGKFLASAEEGVTVMLCSWRPDADVDRGMPEQETITVERTERKRARKMTESLRMGPPIRTAVKAQWSAIKKTLRR